MATHEPLPRAAVLAPPGAGGSAFLGLLYLAILRRSAAEPPMLDLHLGPPELDLAGRLFEALGSGELPRRPAGTTLPAFSARLAPSGRSAGARRPGRSSALGTGRLELLFLPVPESEVADLLRPNGFAGDRLRSGLAAERLLVLIDAAAPAPPAPEGPPPFPWDPLADAVLVARQRQAGPGVRQQARASPPRFVFTRLDRIDPESRASAGLPDPLPETLTPAARDRAVRALRASRLPRVDGRLRALPGPCGYLSWLRPEPGGDGAEPRIALRPAGPGRWEPVHPRDEYDALLDWLLATPG
jgi:hypothetical protein